MKRKQTRFPDMPDIDMNLLKALDALLAERSVTGAANRLGLSVSAMSRSLTRLRNITDDPLLVQAGRQLVPTPYAQELTERVHEITRSAYALLQPAQKALDLTTLERTFTLRANEGFIHLTASSLAAELQKKAPGVRLSFVGKYDKDAQSLRDGTVDLEIGVIGTSAPELMTRTLFSDHFVGICRSSHPLLQAPGVTAERYASYPHVVVSRKNKLYGPVDTVLAKQGLKRRIMMVVPAFANAINIASHSDLIGLVPLSALGWIPGGPERAGLAHFELPIMTPVIKISAIWHPRLHTNPEHRWLRETIISVCQRKPDCFSPWARHVINPKI
ncbi:LysR family transcriptional regulator [Pantoea agglomerans]|uniref:LysR family transcriptional regulator n=1 Tax=Enterobacter agglomerans TaxID=549 RepID=UPI001F5B2088|nr:LysR family transcriptional regulator [Pantoea agglomerans]WNK69560.1 LysR family transcriptional regulator [Pantoea agglomerans]